MKTAKLSVRIDSTIKSQLDTLTSLSGKETSEIIREALLDYFSNLQAPQNLVQVMKRAKALGCTNKGPADLSTNKKYFEGFGK